MTRFLFRLLPSGLLGPAAVYIAAAALNAAIPFALLPLIARWLGPSDFGVVGSFVAIVNVLILLVGLNAYGFVSVGYFRDGAHALPRLAGTAVAVILSASVVVGIAGWLAAGVVERLTQIAAEWQWTLLAAATGQAIIAVGLACAQTIRKPLVYGMLQLGYGLMLGLLTIVAVGPLGFGWPGRALAQALAALTIAVGALVWLGATGRITHSVDAGTVRRVLRFGLPLLPHSFAAVAMGSMDRLALGGSFSSSVIGYYFLALQVASVFTAFAAAVNQAWVPWLYERIARNDTIAWAEIGRTIRIGASLLLLGAAGMALLAAPLVWIVGGESFLPATLPLRLLAISAGFQAWYTLMSAFLFYAERSSLLSILTVATALMQGGLILALLPWGATGVAAALLASTAVAAGAMSLIVRRYALDCISKASPAAPDH